MQGLSLICCEEEMRLPRKIVGITTTFRNNMHKNKLVFFSWTCSTGFCWSYLKSQAAVCLLMWVFSFTELALFSLNETVFKSMDNRSDLYFSSVVKTPNPGRPRLFVQRLIRKLAFANHRQNSPGRPRAIMKIPFVCFCIHEKPSLKTQPG